MAILQCFILDKEINHLLRQLAQVKKLVCCRRVKSQYKLIEPLSDAISIFDVDEEHALVEQFYLLPSIQKLSEPITKDDIKPRMMLFVE